jgi:protein TonB
MALDKRNRAFHLALLISVALHALALLAFPEVIDTGRRAASSPPQITARLMEPAPPPHTAPEKKIPRVVKPATKAPLPEARSPDQYRMQLIDEARRHKRYPASARENNWRGEVLVALTLGAGGRAVVLLKASSGYDVLDRQALEMLEHAARSVPVPLALRGMDFTLDVRAVYGLED